MQLPLVGLKLSQAALSPTDQAIAVGFCGSQGSNFFSTTGVDNAAYESGYWLIYENRSGVGMNHGRPDHPGVFEFVHATHDNMDALPVTLLGSVSLAQTGAQAGAWTTFSLEIDPEAAAQEQIKVAINQTAVYSGAIPEGGPLSGAVQIGFRENHAGDPAASEGTWLDNISIQTTSGENPGQVWLAY